MKVLRQLTFAVLLYLITLLTIHAQPAMKANDAGLTGKVALVDSRVFYHQQLGIQKLLNAYKQLEAEFAPRQAELQVMQNRIVAMNTEINKMGSTPAARAREEELVRLQREFDYKKQEAEAAVNKRRMILVQPINQHIGKALQEFIAARGITLVLDVSKLEEAILAALPGADVTRAFVDDYNARFPVAGGVATNR